MEPPEVQKALIRLLQISGADNDIIIGILLLLAKSEKAQEDLLLWLDEFNSERKVLSREEQGEINRKSVMLHDSLPKDQQTALPIEE